MQTIFTERERRDIAGRARTLHERIDGPSNAPGRAPPICPDRLLEAWKEQFPDEESFRERLAREGLTEADVREHVSATRWPADESLPDWIDTLETLVEHVETTTPAERRAVPVPNETAFVELLAAIASFARDQLPDDIVPMDAVPPMLEWLVTRLERASVRPLYVEFQSFLSQYEPELVDADPDAYTEPPTETYERFIGAVFDGGFGNVCLEYPVLARHIVRLVDTWTEAVVELSHRLRSDRTVLRERFDIDGSATALQPLADDTHAGGRTPIRIAFESGSVVYKPRSVDAGIAFYTILDRLGESLSIPPFETPTYVSRDGYGWMEVIRYRDPDDDAAVDRYYERAGALLCVAYALNATDLQFQNLIVDGAQPTVIDAETVFHPHVDPAAAQFETVLSEVFDGTVFRTALLPVDAGTPEAFDDSDVGSTVGWRENEPRDVQAHPRDRKAQVIAGFGRTSDDVQLSVRFRPTIEAVNTDVMSVVSEPVTRNQAANTPMVDGEDRPPERHLEEIVRGFEETYETIANHHDDGRFLSEIVTPDLIDGIENRLVYRPTHQYDRVRQRLLSRAPLRDGVRSTVEMERLAASFFEADVEADRYWPLYAAERRGLRRLDVPRVTSRVDRRLLSHEGTPLGIGTDESGYERCRRRLEAMTDADRRRQVELIRRCYRSHATSTGSRSPTAVPDDRLRREAVDRFEDVLEAVIDTPTGDSWAIAHPTGANSIRVLSMDESLYRGRMGIALVAAALGRVTGRNRYQRIATTLLDGILRPTPTEQCSVDPGGLQGIGSLVYGTSVIADLLDEPAYRRAAAAQARSVTVSRLEADGAFGVVDGWAGTVLALVACYERVGDDAVLDRATACGNRLLEERTSVDGHQVWTSTDRDRPLTGFARGTAGIAYALARLAATTEDSRYAEAAREALAFDPSPYPPPNERSRVPTADTVAEGWCRGRAGVALSRLGVAEQLEDETLRANAEAALSATAVAPVSAGDSLCCGTLGRVAALLVGSRRAGGSRDAVVELLGRCLARRDEKGAFSLRGHSRSFINPSLFHGISGVAYALLRLSNPDELPCVLLLE